MEPKIKELLQRSEREVIAEFAQTCKDVMKTATAFFDEQAHHYEKNTYTKVRKELAHAIVERLFHCFDLQVKGLRQ